MNKKISIMATFAFLLVAQIFAEGIEGNIESIAAAIAKKDSVRTEFVQTKHLKKLNKDFKGSGSLIFSKKFGIIWQTITPVKTSYVLTDKEILQVNSNGKVQKIDASKNVLFSKFSSILRSVFAGNSQEITKNFELTIAKTNNEVRLSLIPKDQNVKSVVARLEIILGDYINEFTIFEPNGDFTRYKLSNLTYPYELSTDEQKLFIQ